MKYQKMLAHKPRECNYRCTKDNIPPLMNAQECSAYDKYAMCVGEQDVPWSPLRHSYIYQCVWVFMN